MSFVSDAHDIMSVSTTYHPHSQLLRERKAWAREQGVHGADRGNLSSYAFTPPGRKIAVLRRGTSAKLP